MGVLLMASLGDDPRVTDESKIATHDDPVWRERTNYIVRLDLTDDGMPGCFEQMWTRTEEEQRFELCCIPLFTCGLSLGDVVSLASDTGAYRVESKVPLPCWLDTFVRGPHTTTRQRSRR